MTTTPTSRSTALDGQLHIDLRNKVEHGELELPVLSHVATQVAQMSFEGNTDGRGLADRLSRDPALAGHVLRVANSAVYAPVEPIVSLPQAVSHLGFASVGQIAFSIAVGSRVFNVRGHDDWVLEMWRHATLSAGWGREIARVRRRNVETAFICGLLHDIGRPVLLQAIVDLSNKRQLTPQRPEIEPLIDELHALAGAKLAHTWKMAAWMQAAILEHHGTGAIDEHADECWTTRFVDELVSWTLDHGDEAPDAAIARLRASPAIAPLGLYEDELRTLLARAPKVREFAGALQ